MKRGTRPPLLLEDLDRLLEELVARIENLPLFIPGVIAMFPDDHDAIDCQMIAATPQGFGDGGIDREAMLGSPLAAQVAVGTLIDVQRDNLQRRLVPLAVPRVSHQEAVSHVLRVGQIPPNVL